MSSLLSFPAPRNAARLPLPTTRVLALVVALSVSLAACDSSSPSTPTDQSNQASSGSQSSNAIAINLDDAKIDQILSKFSQDSRDRASKLLKAIASKPSDANKQGAFAMFAHAHNHTEMALEFYDNAASLSPETFQWYYLPAIIHAQNGSNAKALSALRKAQRLKGDYPPLQLLLADLLIKEEQVDNAKSELDALLSTQPTYAKALRLSGQLALDEKRYEFAISQLKSAVLVVPHYGSAHFALANAYRATNQPLLADAHTKLFTEHRRREPATADSVLTQVENLRQSTQQSIREAARLSAERKLEEAAKVFEDLLLREPDNAVAHINLIGLYGETGEIAKAESHYAAGLKIVPDNVSLHNNFGVLMLKQKRYEPAVEAFNRAIEVDPEYGAPYKYLGLSQQQLGSHTDALGNFRHAYEKDPTDQYAGSLLASALSRSGELNEAVDVYSRITVVENRNTARYLIDMASTYYRLNDPSKSESTLQRARSVASRFGQNKLVDQIDLTLNQIRDSTSDVPR